jgi:hypothetical protein
MILNLVSSFEVLGLTFNKLKWEDKVEAITMVKRASKRLDILRVSSRSSGVPSADLLIIYFCLVRSLVLSGILIARQQYFSDKIELVQKRAMRIIYRGHIYNEALRLNNALVWKIEKTKAVP